MAYGLPQERIIWHKRLVSLVWRKITGCCLFANLLNILAILFIHYFNMKHFVFDQLYAEGLLSSSSFEKIKSQWANKLLSVHWELRTILYLGILLLSSGLSILVYKNIDTIGHQAVLIFIAIITIGGFYYCYKNKLPFSMMKVEAPNSFFDYLLLLSCLCFIAFIGYLQYQYHAFGYRFGLVTFIPMVTFLFCAYFFDHLGILSLGITNLAAWVGIAVTPADILKANDFNSPTIIITGLLLGIALVLIGKLTLMRNLKSHFAFTYTNFGMHIAFICCLAGLFYFNAVYLLWFLMLIGIAFYFYTVAVKNKSFYLLLVLTLYSYIGLCYVVFRFLFYQASSDGSFYAAFMYLILSAIGLIYFLIAMNKKIKKT